MNVREGSQLVTLRMVREPISVVVSYMVCSNLLKQL